MLIDWFTVLAQIVNFLILVWLLKRFLYKPVLAAIAAREKSIVDQLAGAKAIEATALKEREEFTHKNEEFDRQRATLLNKAADEAAAERRQLLDEARKDADRMRAKLQESLSSEYQGLHDEIARRTQAEVFALARKTLADLAGTNLEARMVDVFVRRLRELDKDETGKLTAMPQSFAIPPLVRSAFDLKLEQRTSIEAAIRDTFAAAVHVSFEVVPELVSGIELVMQGRKIAWSISDYLASLEKDVADLLKARQETKAGTNIPSPLQGEG